jgi:hypothetical protein
MGKAATGAVFAVAMVAVIVAVDILFLRHHPWPRLVVNIAIVAITAAIYLVVFRRR